MDKDFVSELMHSIATVMLQGQVRIQMHLQDGLEARYILMTYGIPAESKCMATAENDGNY